MSSDRRSVGAGEDRGLTITDSLAAGTVIFLTVVLAAALGTGVLLGTDEAGPPDANFTFSYIDANDALIVTHSRGDAIPAGDIVLTEEESGATATWSEVAGTNNSTLVGEGDTIQLSARSAFGAPIGSRARVRVEWHGGNQTALLARWPRDN
jgi:hypothetical protein